MATITKISKKCHQQNNLIFSFYNGISKFDPNLLIDYRGKKFVGKICSILYNITYSKTMVNIKKKFP